MPAGLLAVEPVGPAAAYTHPRLISVAASPTLAGPFVAEPPVPGAASLVPAGPGAAEPRTLGVAFPVPVGQPPSVVATSVALLPAFLFPGLTH